MKLKILFMLLVVFCVPFAFAEDVAETPVVEEEPNSIGPDQPVLHGLEKMGEWFQYKFTRKVNKAEYRLQKIRERQTEMEQMAEKYQHREAQAEKFIEKARANMEKHMQRISKDLEVTTHNEVVKNGLERSRERLMLMLENRPDSKGLKRALETHDINIEKIRLRIKKVIEEKEEEDIDEIEDENKQSSEDNKPTETGR